MRRYAILFSACLASGVVAFGPSMTRAADPADQKTTSENVSDAARDTKDNSKDAARDLRDSARAAADQTIGATELKFPAGFTTKDLKEEKDIRGELANLTNDAVDHNHFDNLVGNFVDQDRDRMKDVKNSDVTALNEKIGDIRRAWKDKYGQDFDAKKVSFSEGFAILQGEVTDPNQAMANWPVPATMQIAAGGDRGAAEVAGHVEGKKSEINLEKGRNVALVQIPASHGMPGLTISLIHELPDQWRIDVPNNISGQQLKDNLMKHLSMVSGMKDQWPSDVNDAYRAVSHHVAMAIYNVDAPMDNAASGGTSGGTTGTDTSTNR